MNKAINTRIVELGKQSWYNLALKEYYKGREGEITISGRIKIQLLSGGTRMPGRNAVITAGKKGGKLPADYQVGCFHDTGNLNLPLLWTKAL